MKFDYVISTIYLYFLNCNKTLVYSNHNGLLDNWNLRIGFIDLIKLCYTNVLADRRQKYAKRDGWSTCGRNAAFCLENDFFSNQP